jgi:seryl-tRNA(Sec) selenium transferase
MTSSGNWGVLGAPTSGFVAGRDALTAHDQALRETIAAHVSAPLAVLAALFDRLGEERYVDLARRGEQTTNAAMANYALDQIEQARAAISER